MTSRKFSDKDYPIAEKCEGFSGPGLAKQLKDLTVEDIVTGDVTIENLRIAPGALRQQADIARSVYRDKLAENFDRGAEMVGLPQSVIMNIYELLRPGRAKNKEMLLREAESLRNEFNADGLAEFIEEAADVYERRGLFASRY